MFKDLIPYTNIHEMNLDWIIAKVKEYISKVDIVEVEFDSLKKYVDDFIDNLDIQQEVNNKLQEMYDNGELASLIAQFLQTESLLVFNTLNDLKNATNFINGITALKLGKLEYNDGETNLYKIRELRTLDVIDEINIISLTNYPSLVGELLPNKSINDLNDKIDDAELELKNDIDSITTFHTVTRNNNPDIYATDYYVDISNGDDENNGLSIETSFKTLQPIIDLLNKGKNFIFITFVSGGTYYWGDYHNMWDVIIHMNRASTNINPIIHFESNMVIYNSRINCDGITFEFDNNETMRMYGDNTFFTMNNCVVKGTLGGYGGSSLDTTSSEFYSLSFTQSHIRINGIIVNSNKDTPLTFNYGCYVLLTGNLKYMGSNNGASNSSLIYLSSSDISIVIGEPDLTELTGKPMYGLRLYQSKAISNTNRLNLLATIGTNGNSIPSPNLYVTTASII